MSLGIGRYVIFAFFVLIGIALVRASARSSRFNFRYGAAGVAAGVFLIIFILFWLLDNMFPYP